MREEFKTVNFKDESLKRIEECNAIIADYQAEGLKLTLRQLYYQLVTKNIIPNHERSYKNLSTLVTDARMSGLMDWSAIEDRVRVPKEPSEWDSIQDLVETALQAYRLPRWADQDEYVELWVEKDALAGVLWPIARKFHVTLMVNRGYSSASAMYEASKRFQRAQDGDKNCVLLYLGDLDPSGEDMVRDIGERLRLFEADVAVDKIALTPSQVKKYKPPPNPAKVTDPRAAAYIAEHGHSSWEVDALPPNVLQKLITTSIREHLDEDKYDAVVEQEEQDKEGLRLAAEALVKGL